MNLIENSLKTLVNKSYNLYFFKCAFLKNNCKNYYRIKHIFKATLDICFFKDIKTLFFILE